LAVRSLSKIKGVRSVTFNDKISIVEKNQLGKFYYFYNSFPDTPSRNFPLPQQEPTQDDEEEEEEDREIAQKWASKMSGSQSSKNLWK